MRVKQQPEGRVGFPRVGGCLQCGTQGSHRSEEPRSRTGQGCSFRETDAVENFSLKQPDAPKCVSPLTPPFGILSSPNTLMVTLTWHNTQMNRECSGSKRFRLRGGDFLFEAELENKVTACGDAGGEGTAGGAGHHVDMGTSGSTCSVGSSSVIFC